MNKDNLEQLIHNYSEKIKCRRTKKTGKRK